MCLLPGRWSGWGAVPIGGARWVTEGWCVMSCDYCGYALESDECVVRGSGRVLCSVCVGRLGDHLDPVIDDLSDLQPVGVTS